MTANGKRSGGDKPKCNGLRKNGERCTRPAGWGTQHPGIGRCKLHLGNTESHVKAAEKVKAEQVTRQLWASLDSVSPITDPLDRLARMAASLESTAEFLAERIEGMRTVSAGDDLSRLRGEVTLWERVLGQLRQALEALARLGIAGRAVELDQGRAELVVQAWLAAVAVLSPTREQREAATGVFLERLGVASAGPVVAGEVEG